MLNGTLGDKSFNDSAADGMEMIAQELSNVETKVVEMTFDDTKWEPAVLDACDEGYDIIITGTWQMQEIIARELGIPPTEICLEQDGSRLLACETKQPKEDAGNV